MHISKSTFSTVFAATALLGIGAASGADLSVKAPYVHPASSFSWTGCYLGGHAGAGIVHDQGFQPNLNLNFGDRHGFGGLAGGQIGCNYQTGMLVLGIEGEGFWSGMKINVDQFGQGNNGNTLLGSIQIRNKWDYDVAGRIGVAFDRALVYGKAGWVFGGFDWNFATTAAPANFFQYTNQGSATLDGLLIGVGIEYAFATNWTVKFEYDYLGFTAKNVVYNFRCTLNCIGGPPTFTENVSADKHIFKVGINYLFNTSGPVVARY